MSDKFNKKDFERSIKIKEFQEDMEVLLEEEDREYVQYALKEFSTYRNVPVLIKALLSCLKTPEMLDLLPVIRELLPKREQKEFDRLAPYHKMAHPIQRLKNKKGAAKHLHKVWLERSGRLPLGFSIRGGKEMGLGIYVSDVDAGSPSDAAGMRIGDQIIEVNGIDFEWISHPSAVKVIKTFRELEILTYNAGRLPKFEESGEAFRWIDPLGNPVEIADLEEIGDQPFSSTEKKKVVIKKQPGRSVGLRIRGGKEFKLGIFVVSVDEGSLAEEQGLKVGDQIFMVNGISFRNILHDEAASILKSHNLLMMSVQCVGRIPHLKSQYRKKEGRKDEEMEAQKKDTVVQRPSFKEGLTESPKFSRMGQNDKKKQQRQVSPLAETERRASGIPMKQRDVESDSADDISIEDDDKEGSSKFQYGIGTQVMLSSTVHNPVRELILDKANKMLSSGDEVTALERRLADYEDNEDLIGLVDFLVSTLDTPAKMEMVDDIRPALKPQDLAEFDKRMSTHELKAKKKKKKRESMLNEEERKKEEEEELPEPAPVVIKPMKRETEKQPPPKKQQPSENFETVRQNIVVKASRVIKAMAELKSLDRRLTEYGSNGDVEFLVNFLLTILDNPKKHVLLLDVRKLIKEEHLSVYDTKVAPYLPQDGSSTGPHRKLSEPMMSAVGKPQATSTPAATFPKAKSTSVLTVEVQSEQPSVEERRVDTEAIRQKLVLSASKVLKIKDELKALERKLKMYEINGDIGVLMNFILTIFDSPKKRIVLPDFREFIKQKDLAKFDEMVAPFVEKKPVQEKKQDTPTATKTSPPSTRTTSTSKEDVPKPINIPPPPMPPPVSQDGTKQLLDPGSLPGSIAAEIKSRGGASVLRKVEVKNEDSKGSEGGGVFIDPAAQEVLHKAKTNKQDIQLPQTRESFLAWNEDYSASKAQGGPKIVVSPGKPLHLEIQKTAFFLGIELKQNEEGSLLIDEIVADGAAFNDGFLTPGFTVLKVDETDLQGRTVGDAEALINESYDSDKPSVYLLVVPPA